MNVESKLQFNRSLRGYSTFQIGGEARYFISADSIEDLKNGILFAKEKNIKYFVLGKGSNILFDDKGFDGLVILNKIEFCQVSDTEVFAGAGCSLMKLAKECAKNNLTGLEFAIGIPGSVGGGLYMNASSHKQQLSDTLKEVIFIDDSGLEIHLKKQDLMFSYRNSYFQKVKGSIAAAYFSLSKGENIESKTFELLNLRKSSQPWDKKSAGCVFKNPVNNSAGRLIDALGLKGKSVGGAMVSSKHANFIVNENNASAKDVLELVALIKKEVKEKADIDLHEEICYIPY